MFQMPRIAREGAEQMMVLSGKLHPAPARRTTGSARSMRIRPLPTLALATGRLVVPLPTADRLASAKKYSRVGRQPPCQAARAGTTDFLGLQAAVGTGNERAGRESGHSNPSGAAWRQWKPSYRQ
ncbi:hypothetical protein [Sandarakinorhabdus sp.]|uniref:hypothetical protein n=1 Tax=Sandarakinorhabdus sp. TaxID=1916663 RepID=UPI003F71A5DD